MTRTFVTPAEALAEMRAAGAVFKLRPRHDGLGLAFTYKVGPGGDAQACRRLLAAAKGKPKPFMDAFRAAVQREAEVAAS